MDDLSHIEEWSLSDDEDILNLIDFQTHPIPDVLFSNSNEPYESYGLPNGQRQFGVEHINHDSEVNALGSNFSSPHTLMCQPRSIYTELENTQNLTSETDQTCFGNLDPPDSHECMWLNPDQSLW
jgi:hypothetical protein